MQKAREEVVGNPKIKVLDVPPPILGRPLADLASALADVYRVTKPHHTLFGDSDSLV